MSFDSFKTCVENLIAKAGGGIKVDFSTDDNGKYVAKCADGVIITGNSIGIKLSVRWGSGHQSMAMIAG